MKDFDNMIEHTIRLLGPGAGHGKPSPEAIGPLLSALGPAVRDCLRIAFFSSSRIKGRPYKALQRAWDIRLSGIRGGSDESTEVILEAPRLGEAAPLFYEQMDLWDDAPGPDETALDVLGSTLTDINSGQPSSNRYDLPLLLRLHRFDRVLRAGVTRMTLEGHHLVGDRISPPIERTFIETVDSMMDATPSSRRVRIHGTLDMVRCSDRVFEIVTLDGERLRSAWIPADVAPLKEYLDQAVLIEGEAMFRPSGSVLRVDADAIRQARSGDEFFSLLPRPANGFGLSTMTGAIPERRKSGFDSLAGGWPGDESIGELIDALAEMGR